MAKKTLAPRLTDEEVDALVQDFEMCPRADVDRAVAELREARAVLAALKAAGCPPSTDVEGAYVCAFCGGGMIGYKTTPQREWWYEHRDVDGEPCPWVRIESL